MDEKIAKLWAMLQELRGKSAAVQKAPVFQKINLAQDMADFQGDVIKALIGVVAYQAGRITELENAVREINSERV